MSCLKTLLLVLAIVFQKVVSACCDNWNGDCALAGNQSLCDGSYYSGVCKWSSGACVNKVCADYTSSGEGSCNGVRGSGDKKINCKWSSSACVDGTGTCEDFSYSSSICGSEYDASSGSRCFYDSATSKCRKKECGDYNNTDSDTCNRQNDVGGEDKECKYDTASSTCVPMSTCAEITTGSTDCSYHYQNGVRCTTDSTDQKCRPTKCADIALSSCDGAGVGSDECVTSGTNCVVATKCADYPTTSSECLSSKFDCIWDGDLKCVPNTVQLSCGSFDDTLCPCDLLTSCPPTGSSSVVFVPALIVTLLLMFW